MVKNTIAGITAGLFARLSEQDPCLAKLFLNPWSRTYAPSMPSTHASWNIETNQEGEGEYTQTYLLLTQENSSHDALRGQLLEGLISISCVPGESACAKSTIKTRL
jgi:hypothetical protein